MQEALLNHLKNVWPEYELGARIGSGSYAEVYRAVRKDLSGEPTINDYAAVKIIEIPKDMSEVEALQSAYGSDVDVHAYYQEVATKYMREVRTMQALNGNSNIVEIKDYRCLKRQHSLGWAICILMELLTPLTKYVRDVSLDEDEVIKLGIDICTALEECEKRRIVHRDIKPDNLFVDINGNFKLGDFGVARTLNDLTSGMSQKGTPNYWSPEANQNDDCGSSSDIYSLGIVLYQMMNNKRLPFIAPDQSINPSTSEEALQRRMRGDPLPPAANASAAFNAVILKACAFSRANRFQSAAEMKQALLRVQKGEPPFASGSIPWNNSDPNGTVRALPPMQPNAFGKNNESKPVGTAPGIKNQPGIQQPPQPVVPENEDEEPQRKGNGLMVFGILLLSLLAIAALTVAGVFIIKYIQKNKSGGSNGGGSGGEPIETADVTIGGNTAEPSATPTAGPDEPPEPNFTSLPTDEPVDLPTPSFDPAEHYSYGLDIGHTFVIGLRSDGTVTAAGRYRDSAQDPGVVDGVKSWANIVQVAAGWDFAIGLTAEGRVLFAGAEQRLLDPNGTNPITSWGVESPIRFIAANGCACAAIAENGKIYISGGPGDATNVKYQIPSDIYSDNTNRPVSISVGTNHILVLYEKGDVRAIYHTWGSWCDVGSWRKIVQVAAGDYCSFGLTEDGSILHILPDENNPNETGKGFIKEIDLRDMYGKKAISICCKGGHICVTNPDGSVSSYGWNKYNQLVTYDDETSVAAVATSAWATAALFSDGTVSITGNVYDPTDTEAKPEKYNIFVEDIEAWEGIVQKR